MPESSSLADGHGNLLRVVGSRDFMAGLNDSQHHGSTS